MKNHTGKERGLRILYACAFILLFTMEVIIALFIHDQLIRPYLGDVLVVMVLYCAVRILVPERIRMLPLYLFLFAFMVECLQAIHIVKLLGLENSRFFRVLIGSTFDIKDVICYGVGCIILGFYEWRIHKR